MSTSMVPCQRRDWWEAEVGVQGMADKFSPKAESWPLSMADGLRMKDEFRAEREDFRKTHTDAMKGYQEWDFGDQDPTHGDEDEDEE